VSPGQLASTRAIPSAVHHFNLILASEAPLTLHSVSVSPDMKSALDEIAIWNRPLTDAEIKALYNNGHGVELK
jgi:hypothetical protein